MRMEWRPKVSYVGIDPRGTPHLSAAARRCAVQAHEVAMQAATLMSAAQLDTSPGAAVPMLLAQVGEHLPRLVVTPGMREDVPQRHLSRPRGAQIIVSLQHRFGLPVTALVDGQPHVL